MNATLESWIEQSAALTRPDHVVVCDGSDAEIEGFRERMLADGTLIELNQKAHPGCYLHRSHPSDVARVENRTFICSREQRDAGPTNNWMSPDEARSTVEPLFKDSMRGRTMYVIPYVMGPSGSPSSRVGVEITDSLYVVANMRIMTRMGKVDLEQLGESGTFVPGLHSTGDLDPDKKFILHFPEERLIWSFGSGYGGNALLGKKCFALRIAGAMARDEGWMAEHMLILELQNPAGELTYFAAAFPSACGKTNFAMLISPLEDQGWKVKTVGDDIAWMRVGEDGRLWAVNAEAGFFGVAPGTNERTNPNALRTMQTNAIYTNVAVTDDGIPWWERKSDEPPPELTDWLGERWTGERPAAHPNSRFTAPARQCPSMSSRWEDPEGVPISGVIFGGRRTRGAPLVYQSFDWKHGVFVGATMSSETTAAAAGTTGVLRRDPMAMLPFCGYNMGDYFGHWLAMGERIPNPPLIFHVNWFRQDADSNFLWPGYSQNIRPLIWMHDRVRGTAEARETPIGYVPQSLNLAGLDIADSVVQELLAVKSEDWRAELPGIRQFFDGFDESLPTGVKNELTALELRLGA